MADTLSAFMKENVEEKAPVLYVASKRFKGPDGEPLEWQLRSLSNDEMKAIIKKCEKKTVVKGSREYKTEFDGMQFQREIAVSAVVYPDLDLEELQTSWGVVGRAALLEAMLTPGELADLEAAAVQASDVEAGMDDKIKKVKNS